MIQRLRGIVGALGLALVLLGCSPASAPRPAEVKEAKSTTLKLFEEAVALYYRQEFREAHRLFLSCCNKNPHDQTAKIYLEHCQQMISAGQQADWSGITKL